MALTDPSDTIAYHNSRIFTAHRDMSDVPCSAVADALSKFSAADVCPNTVPEREALWFYGMNHVTALISARRAPYEPLTPWENGVFKEYHGLLGPKAVRAFYYLIWICTREARHPHDLAVIADKLTTFGPGLTEFFKGINGGEAGISKKFLQSPPPCSIGAYCKALCFIFYHAHFGGGFGGAKWGNIADVLCKFVHGEYSAEMMLDTNWTLAHNGGPIFNKGQFYKHYDASDLARILDIQRSGQVPEAVLYDTYVKKYADPGLASLLGAAAVEFPGKLGNYVDWLLVEALGAVKKYPGDIKAQKAAHNMTPEQQALLDKIALEKEFAIKAAQAAEIKAKEDHAKNFFEIMPGVEVQKFQRAA